VNRPLLLLSLCLFFCVACHRKSTKVTLAPPAAPVSSAFDRDEKILFLGMKVFGNARFLPERAELIEAKVVTGRAKTEPEEGTGDGSITFSFQDVSGQVLRSFSVANPLMRRVEFANQNGEMQSREVKAKEVEHTFRANVPPGSVRLLVTTVASDPQAPSVTLLEVVIK
jgi:hypothetical protein